jgi:hypothetical protein
VPGLQETFCSGGSTSLDILDMNGFSDEQEFEASRKKILDDV